MPLKKPRIGAQQAEPCRPFSTGNAGWGPTWQLCATERLAVTRTDEPWPARSLIAALAAAAAKQTAPPRIVCSSCCQHQAPASTLPP